MSWEHLVVLERKKAHKKKKQNTNPTRMGCVKVIQEATEKKRAPNGQSWAKFEQ